MFAGLPATTLIGLEVKASGFEAQFAEQVRRSGRGQRLVVGSGKDEVADRCARCCPRLPQYFPRSAGVRFAAAAKLTNGALARPDYQVFAVPLNGAGLRLDTAGMIRVARAAGVMITFWTINDAAEMDRLVRLGADGIITDYPSRAIRLGCRPGQGLRRRYARAVTGGHGEVEVRGRPEAQLAVQVDGRLGEVRHVQPQHRGLGGARPGQTGADQPAGHALAAGPGARPPARAPTPSPRPASPRPAGGRRGNTSPSPRRARPGGRSATG